MATIYEISEKIFRMEQAGSRIIKFNVGDPDQRTDRRIVQACTSAIKRGFTKYGSSRGEIELLTKLAELHGVKPENIFISPGSKFSIFAAMDALLKADDNIVLPSPHWSAYELIARRLGAKVRFLKTRAVDGWQISPEELERLIDSRTKLIILCNPNNPTSTVIGKKALDSIVAIGERRSVPILSDECYADISFRKVKSVADYGLDNICVKSFSKTFAMTGWRIGYAIAKSDLVERFTKLAQITTTNVPVFVQHAAAKALDIREEAIKNMRGIYKRRADMALSALKGAGLEIQRPDAPFYLFPRYGGDSDKLALDLIDKGVAITPGTAFGDYGEYFRLALTLPEVEMASGLGILANEFARGSRRR